MSKVSEIDLSKVGNIDRSKTGTPVLPIDESTANTSTNKNKIPLTKTKSLSWKRLVRTFTTNKTSTSIDTTNWKPIGMKIVEQSYNWSFKSECRIFTKLLSYKNQTVERYGIPSVWYMGDLLKKFHAIGMTLGSVSLAEKHEECNGQFDPINSLVVFYQVVC